MAGGRRELHNEGLHNFYSSLNITIMVKPRSVSWTWRVARMIETNALIETPEGKRSLGKSKRRWKNNIKMDLGELDGVL
jgi:hypothetical protein